MERMPVTVRVPVVSSWEAGGTLQIYSDHGSGGAVDTTRPLLHQRAEMFPGTEEVVGYGEEPYGATAYGGEEPVSNGGGYGEEPYGEEVDGYGYGSPAIDVRVFVDQGFGVYLFAAESYDVAGNAQGGALIELSQLVSGDTPEALAAFSFSSYDDGTDQVIFAVA